MRICLGNFARGHPRAFFEGVMDEVKIHNRALSAEKIRQHARELAARR